MNAARFARVVCCFAALMIVSGCGGDAPKDAPTLFPVSGKVTYKGAPVEGATVSFSSPKSPRVATGQTDAQGVYKLTTKSSNDGAVEGEHVVTIRKVVAAAGATQMTPEDYAKMMSGNKTGAPPIQVDNSNGGLPAKYADGATSGLKRTVVAGDDNTFDIELTD